MGAGLHTNCVSMVAGLHTNCVSNVSMGAGHHTSCVSMGAGHLCNVNIITLATLSPTPIRPSLGGTINSRLREEVQCEHLARDQVTRSQMK